MFLNHKNGKCNGVWKLEMKALATAFTVVQQNRGLI